MSAVVLDMTPKDFPGRPISTNDLRGSTRFLAFRTSPWRERGLLLARQYRPPRLPPPVRIWVEFRYPTNQRRDTANWYPTVKALVDGLVDAGTIPDDRDGLVEGPWLRRTYPNGPTRIRIILQPLAAGQLGLEFTEEGIP